MQSNVDHDIRIEFDYIIFNTNIVSTYANQTLRQKNCDNKNILEPLQQIIFHFKWHKN